MDSHSKFLIRVFAIAVLCALAFSAVADAKLFDFNPWWPGWDMTWWH